MKDKTTKTGKGKRTCDVPQGPNRHKRNGAGFHDDKRKKRRKTRNDQKKDWLDND